MWIQCDVEVKEENLLDVAIYREVFIENMFDDKLTINPSDKIGEKRYNLNSDNYQHFFNSVIYGIAVKKLKILHLKMCFLIKNSDLL